MVFWMTDSAEWQLFPGSNSFLILHVDRPVQLKRNVRTKLRFRSRGELFRVSLIQGSKNSFCVLLLFVW
jgi:hypothetical protein